MASDDVEEGEVKGGSVGEVLDAGPFRIPLPSPPGGGGRGGESRLWRNKSGWLELGWWPIPSQIDPL